MNSYLLETGSIEVAWMRMRLKSDLSNIRVYSSSTIFFLCHFPFFFSITRKYANNVLSNCQSSKKNYCVLYIYIYTTWKSPGIFQYVAPLENEHDSFREIHLSLVYI